MTTTHNYQQLSLKNKNKNKLSKQLEQEQNHKYGDQFKGYQLEEGRERKGEVVQGSRSISGRNKVDRGMVRIV